MSGCMATKIDEPKGMSRVEFGSRLVNCSSRKAEPKYLNIREYIDLEKDELAFLPEDIEVQVQIIKILSLPFSKDSL